MEPKKVLTKAAKEDIALALILLKDFKSQGRFDVEISKQIFELAEFLGVKEEHDYLLSKIPPMNIKERK